MCLLWFYFILAYFIGLTYWQNAQCQFLFIMSVHWRKCPKSKMLGKFPKNYRNYFSPEDFGSQKDKSRGGSQPPGATQAPLDLGWRPGATWTARPPPRTASSPVYLLLTKKRWKIEVFLQKHIRAAPPSNTLIRGTEVPVPAPCRDWELPLEPSSSPLLPPMMRRE